MTKQETRLANTARDYMDALSDIEAYLPLDDSEHWENASDFLRIRDECEQELSRL